MTLPPEVVTPLNAIMANYPRNSQAYKWAKQAKEAFAIYHVTFVGEKNSLPGLVHPVKSVADPHFSEIAGSMLGRGVASVLPDHKGD